MQVSGLIDYAKPMMDAEQALKNMHQAALHKDFEIAKEFALEAMSYTKLAMHSITIMEEDKNGLRQ
jgi:hypothetical protein